MYNSDIVDNWKALAASKNNTAAATVQYILARALSRHHPDADFTDEQVETTLKYLKKAFGPIRNRRKLENGRVPYDTLAHQLRWYKPVDDVDKELAYRVALQLRKAS